MTAPITNADLERILELEKRATPGPWTTTINYPSCVFPGHAIMDGEQRLIGLLWEGGEQQRKIKQVENAHLMSLAVNSIAAICKELIAARKVIEEALKYGHEYDGGFNCTISIEKLKAYHAITQPPDKMGEK